MAYVNTPLELAQCIDGMSYQGLMRVARQLVDMNKPEGGVCRDVGTPQGMAETLADWAESEVLEDREKKAAAKAAAEAKAA